MNEAWSFWCSKCKKDHSGECPPERVLIVKGSDLLASLDALIKALEAGSYNAKPSVLTQGCAMIVDWDIKLPELLKFIALDFKLP
jgi:hypothetical protein